MGNENESKEHHWWPVGLQSYWADGNGDVSWIEPDGSTAKKRYRNRKIGQKIRGHTLLRGSVWRTNFEGEFSIDTKVHEIIEALIALAPNGIQPLEMEQGLIGEQLNRDLMLFVLSLLIRSPSTRHRYEQYPTIVGLPPNEEVGKANMHQLYKIARRICEKGLISNRHFTILNSADHHFVHGDGCLDWISTGLLAQHISGRALIALTPHLCLYINTPTMMRSNRNYASIRATSSMVERANQIAQIYSKNRLFFLDHVPKLEDAFRRCEFLQHAEFTDELFDDLDKMTGHYDRRGHLPGYW